MFNFKKHQSDINLLINSPIFDREWYISKYSDINKINISPEKHYLIYGFKLGYNPSVFFDTDFYLDKNEDVKNQNINPLIHYIKYGEREHRRPNKYFDTDYYAKKNNINKDILSHFINFVKNNLDINFYKKVYKNINIDPFLHYIYFGYKLYSPSLSLLYNDINILNTSYFNMQDEFKNKFFMDDEYKNSILFLFRVSKKDGVYIWRGLFQKEYLEKNNIKNIQIESIIEPTKDFYKKLFSCKIVIFNRPSISSLSGQILGEIIRLNKILIIDIDDLYDVEETPFFGSVKSKTILYENMKKNILDVQYAFKFCKSISVSTHLLLENVKKYNKINILNKNIISTKYILNEKISRHSKEFSLLIASGSSTHDFDLSTIYLDLINFLKSHEDVSISVIGNTSIDFSFLKNKYTKINFLDFKSMIKCFSMHDILLVPLDKNNFNNAKSNIKFIEAASVFTPVLAKNCDEFNIIRDKKTGFLYDDDFYEKLEWIYDNRHILPKIAKEANDFVLKYCSTQSTSNDFINYMRGL